MLPANKLSYNRSRAAARTPHKHHQLAWKIDSRNGWERTFVAGANPRIAVPRARLVRSLRPPHQRVCLTFGRSRTLMHGVAPQICGQVARPLLGGGTGGRSPGFLLMRSGEQGVLDQLDRFVITQPAMMRQQLQIAVVAIVSFGPRGQRNWRCRDFARLQGIRHRTVFGWDVPVLSFKNLRRLA
jgi:hypothetical protein